MNVLSENVWLEQANLLREIQHLRTAAHLLAIGKPGRARASEAALDLAHAREALVLKQTREMLQSWADVLAQANVQRNDTDPGPGPTPALTDHGDQLLWMVRRQRQL
jgi:shikimate 5-dehydrogenase